MGRRLGQGQVADVAVPRRPVLQERRGAGGVGDQVGVRQHGAWVGACVRLFVSACVGGDSALVDRHAATV